MQAMRDFRSVSALPTWLLAQMMRTVMTAEHPWKLRFFTLPDWAAGRTQFTVTCDFLFWVGGATLLALLIR